MLLILLLDFSEAEEGAGISMGKTKSTSRKEYWKFVRSISTRLGINKSQARRKIKGEVQKGNYLRKLRQVRQDYTWRVLKKSMGRKHRLPDVYKEEWIDYEEDEYFEYL
jgi:hypothetical protein